MATGSYRIGRNLGLLRQDPREGRFAVTLLPVARADSDHRLPLRLGRMPNLEMEVVPAPSFG